MSDKLKPCPFCGSRAHKKEASEGGYIIECPNLECPITVVEVWSFTEKEVTEAWNRRAYTVKMENIKPFHHGTCGDCKHWRQKIRHNICAIFTNITMNFFADEDFYCAKWEAKDE